MKSFLSPRRYFLISRLSLCLSLCTIHTLISHPSHTHAHTHRLSFSLCGVWGVYICTLVHTYVHAKSHKQTHSQSARPAASCAYVFILFAYVFGTQIKFVGGVRACVCVCVGVWGTRSFIAEMFALDLLLPVSQNEMTARG